MPFGPTTSFRMPRRLGLSNPVSSASCRRLLGMTPNWTLFDGLKALSLCIPPLPVSPDNYTGTPYIALDSLAPRRTSLEASIMLLVADLLLPLDP